MSASKITARGGEKRVRNKPGKKKKKEKNKIDLFWFLILNNGLWPIFQNYQNYFSFLQPSSPS